MAIQFKEFARSAFSGSTEDFRGAVVRFCNTEIANARIVSISEAKGISDDFYKIPVWFDRSPGGRRVEVTPETGSNDTP